MALLLDAVAGSNVTLWPNQAMGLWFTLEQDVDGACARHPRGSVRHAFLQDTCHHQERNRMDRFAARSNYPSWDYRTSLA
jgi:hypothetical protein